MNPTSPEGINPFAVTPASQAPPMLSIPDMGFESYRDGKLLAVRRSQASLPPFCLKTNQPTDTRLRRKLYWHHPAVFVALLISPIIYILLAFVMRKDVDVMIPITPEVAKRRIQNMVIAWLIVLAGCTTFVLGIVLLDNRGTTNWSAPLFISTPILILIGAVYGIYTTRLVYPKRIDQHFAWLSGVSPEYLARLQDWPFGKV